MGRIEYIKGKACEHSWECRTGCGLLHGSLAHIAKAYPKETAARIKEYDKQTPPILFDFNYQLAVCKACSAVQSVPMFDVLNGGEVIVGRCPKCNETVEVIKDAESAFCPVCHKLGLVRDTIGMWD